ncbi:hypothetical protein DASB73_004380 [Starmerella bacillaris]|uniref:E3 ubiquitin-protein ligase listerin n=1 Tax=Starmerella bacillaris TaxID=1247836 RepID=A0AAV5RD59_STABA|nr:hypothetical protein DASB73_004380 [Starmerella bacillaris]
MSFALFPDLGEYRSISSAEGRESISLLHSQGLLDPSKSVFIQYDAIFNNLLVNDVCTKLRALTKLNFLLKKCVANNMLDRADEICRSCIQVYSKLSVDPSPLVRTESHALIRALYSYSGPEATKYVKYSFILLLCGKYDIDERVSTSAIASLNELFTATQQTELVQKLKNEIIDFTCSTLHKVVTECENPGGFMIFEHPDQQMCIQISKSCLDSLFFHPVLFDTKNEQILSLLKNVLFKFILTKNSHLVSGVMRIVRSNIDSLGFCLPEFIEKLGHNIFGKVPGVNVEVLRTVNILLRNFPSVWSQVSCFKPLILERLLFLPHISEFWPLLYDYFHLEPDPSNLKYTMDKMGRFVGCREGLDMDLVNSAWSLYTQLHVELNSEFRRFKESVIERCTRPFAPTAIMSKCLSRILDEKSLKEIDLNQPTEQFLLVLAGVDNTECTQYVSSFLISQNIQDPNILKNLLGVNPNLELPDLEPDASLPWVRIACIRNEYSEKVVEKFIQHGEKYILLENARDLGYRDPGALDEYVLKNDSDIDVLENAVYSAGYLVSDEVGNACYEKLVSQASENNRIKRVLNRVKLNDFEYFNTKAQCNSLRLKPLDLKSLNSCSQYIITNFLKIESPPPEYDASHYPDVSSYMKYLDFEPFYKLAVLNEFLHYWYLAAPTNDQEAYNKFFNGFDAAFPDPSAREIANLRALFDENSAEPFIAMYSILALARIMKRKQMISADPLSLLHIDSDPLKQILSINFNSQGLLNKGFQEHLKSLFYTDGTKFYEKLEPSYWKFVAPNSGWKGVLKNDIEMHLCWGITALQTGTENLAELAFESSSKVVQYTAFRYLDSADLTQVVHYAQALEVVNNADDLIAEKCLYLVRNNQSQDTDADWMVLLQKRNLNLQSIALYIDIQIDVDVMEFDINVYPVVWLLQMKSKPQMFNTPVYTNPIFNFVSKYLQATDTKEGTRATLARRLLDCVRRVNNDAFEEFYNNIQEKKLLDTLDVVLKTDMDPICSQRLKAMSIPKN